MINVGLNQGDFKIVQVDSEIADSSFISLISVLISLSSLNVILITSLAAFSFLCSNNHLGLSGINAIPINKITDGTIAKPSIQRHPSISAKA